METNKTCPSCGKPIGPDAPQGLCPACLMRVGVGSFTVPADGTMAQTGSFEPPSMEDLARLFPQLEVLDLIGKGGMGAVYKARQKDLDRLVALKVLPAQAGTDAGFAERFTREARALARLAHPHIVAVYDFGQVEGLHYFIMEYVDGTNLRQVERSGGLESRQALAIIPQICEALQFAHDKGVVHRDIKPENILLDREGRVKIADFGLAKILGQRQDLTLTQEGHVMGTPHYMAPEQVEHPQAVDHRADIYSLGVVFYEMFTGELPLGKFQPPSAKVQIDVRLDEVVLRTLEKEPERRYQQASQVKTEVETIAGTSAEVGDPIPPDDTGLGEVKREVRGPAIGLLITGILNWIMIPLSILVIGAIAKIPWVSWVGLNTPHLWPSWIPSLLIAVLCLCSFFVWAAFKMMRLEVFGAAVAASVLAILISPGNVIGLPIGIWSLVVLAQQNVRDGFERNRRRRLAAMSRPSPIANQWGIEYQSKRMLWGLPLVHVATGVDPETGRRRVARGIIAIGDVAHGVVAFGGQAFGGIAFGGLAVGVMAIGGAGFGLLAVGGLAVGLIAAFGGGAIGTIALGGGAIGVIALGGGAIGYCAYGGDAWGVHVVSGIVKDPVALAFFEPWATTLMQDRIRWISMSIFFAIMLIGIGVPAIVRTRLARGRRTPEARSAWIFGFFLPLIILLIVFLNLKPRTTQWSGPFSPVRSMTLFEKGSAAVDYPVSGPFVARLPQGTVELVGVSYHPSADQPWWMADGLSYTGQPLFTWGSHSTPYGEQMAREFVVRLSGLPEDASRPTWKVDPVAGWAGGGVGHEPNQGSPELRMLSATVPASARSVTLRVGVGMGPWETVAEGDAGGTGMSSTSRYGRNWTVSFLKASELDGSSRTTVIHTVKDWDVRVVAVDTHDLEHTSNRTEGEGMDAFSETTATFVGLSLAQVKVFRFQVRPYQWVEFRNVSLNLGYKTQVEVVHAKSAMQHTAPPAGSGHSPQMPSFGPVIERVVSGEGDANRRFIDLDTGRLFTAAELFGPKDEPSPDQTRQLWARTGIDAVGDTSPPVRGLVGFEMVAVPLGNEEWDHFAVSQFASTFAVASPSTPVLMSAKGELPMTYAIKTREGGMGILQITGLTDNPPGAKIRYKLAHSQLPETSMEATASALQFRLVAHEGSSEPADLLSDPDDPSGQRQLCVLRQVLMDGSAVANAGLTFERDGRRSVYVKLTPAGGRQFKDITGGNMGRQLAIVFRGRLVSVPVIQTRIDSGKLMIAGRFNASEVHEMVDALNRALRPTESSWNLAGPFEVVLPLVGEEPNFVLYDLDTDRWATNRVLRPDLRESHEWLGSVDADVIALGPKSGLPFVTGYDLVFATAPSQAWDVVTAADLVQSVALNELSLSQEIRRAKTPGEPDTFLFRTREGGRGVLQILGFTDNPRGVKIRYKLLEGRPGDSRQSVAAGGVGRGSFVQSLAQGRLELVAVSGDPCEGGLWWRPDGSPWTQGPFQVSPRERFRKYVAKPTGPGVRHVCQLALRGLGLPEGAWWSEYRIKNASGTLYYDVSGPDGQEDPNLRVLEVSVPSNTKRIDVEIAFGVGPWERAAVYEPNQSTDQQISLDTGTSVSLGPCSRPNVMSSQIYDRGKAWIMLRYRQSNCQIRAMAYDLNGAEHSTSVTWVFPKGGITERVHQFELDNNNVKTFELQVRPYQWVTFRGVELQPRSDVLDNAGSSDVQGSVRKAPVYFNDPNH